MASILLCVDQRSDILICTNCSAEHPPHLRFCTNCGTKLPPPSETVDFKSTTPSGRDHGVEPDPDKLYEEPVYKRRRASDAVSKPSPILAPLPTYDGFDDIPGEVDADAPDETPAPLKQRSGFLVGLMVFLSIAVPPLGFLFAIFWFFNRAYRQAVFPLVAASVLGAGLWGWGLYIDIRSSMYDGPHDAALVYIEAQDWAMERTGHYQSMLELKLNGYLPSDYPSGETIEFSIEEHVLGPTGYIVEIRPGSEESRIYRMTSLWVDQTGDIRRGTRDGPRFER